MPFWRLISGFTLLMLALSPFAGSANAQQAGEVPLIESAQYPAATQAEARLAQAARWQQFTQSNGAWAVAWNAETGTPHRAFGPAIKLNQAITAASVESASRSFIQQHATLLGLQPSTELKLQRSQHVDGRWYVTFRQQLNGRDVLFSELELRLSDAGDVIAFGAKVYPPDDAPMNPAVSAPAASQHALEGLLFNPAFDQATPLPQLTYLPIREGPAFRFHLAYAVDIELNQSLNAYRAYVDAVDGTILWRYSTRFSSADDPPNATPVQASGVVHPASPEHPVEERPFSYLSIQVGDQSFTTDAAGSLTLNIAQPDTLTAFLQGPFVDVFRGDGTARSHHQAILHPGQSATLTWADSTVLQSERDVFYWVNATRAFAASQLPDPSVLNVALPAHVQLPADDFGVCNAFYLPEKGLHFLPAGESTRYGPCGEFGEHPNVIAHEYGHAINHLIYQAAGAEEGMINRTVHEGLADLTAALLLDEPRIGLEAFHDIAYVRTLDNQKVFPDSLQDAFHADGTILGGAFWTLRESLSREEAMRLSLKARYGLPDDLDAGTAFLEWFLETLIADDDDGNLGNGTPNDQAIIDAFNQHGIGTNLFVASTFSHSPPAFMQNAVDPYPISFTLHGFQDSAPGTTKVVYSTDAFATQDEVEAQPEALGQYLAWIPPQPAGSRIDYYIETTEPFSGDTLRLPQEAPAASYFFLAGFTSFVTNHFENAFEATWETGGPEDTEPLLNWILAEPTSLTNDFGATVLVPGEDHSPNGTLCYMTGVSKSYPFWLTGQSTLTSHRYDVSEIEQPHIAFYRWVTAFPDIDHQGNLLTPGKWQVDVSADDGATWINVVSDSTSLYQGKGEPAANYWHLEIIDLAQHVALTQEMRIRVVAHPFTRALIDDFMILGIESNVATTRTTPEYPQWTLALEPNYPNPFASSTTITFTLPEASPVQLSVFDLLGRKQRTLIANQVLPAGRHTHTLDAHHLSSGLYFYELQTPSRRLIKQMHLVR